MQQYAVTLYIGYNTVWSELCECIREKLSAVSYVPLAHARHNVGDRNAKVGHEIIVIDLTSGISTASVAVNNRCPSRRYAADALSATPQPDLLDAVVNEQTNSAAINALYHPPVRPPLARPDISSLTDYTQCNVYSI